MDIDPVMDESNRINAAKSMSDFEREISNDIFAWVMMSDHNFTSIEDASIAFWSERLGS